MSTEFTRRVLPGMAMVPVVGLLTVGGLGLTIWAAFAAERGEGWAVPVIWAAVALQVLGWALAPGFFALQPNESRVLVLFGNYRGTVRTEGFHWGNPFYSNVAVDPRRSEDSDDKKPMGARAKRAGLTRFKVSLRARAMQGDHLKVNDKRGNPVEIGAVVVWRVAGSAQAMFDVGDLVLDGNGIARRGLLVRHLVLPAGIGGTGEVLRFLATEISRNTYLNLMDQYRPCYRAGEHSELSRRPTGEEMRAAFHAAAEHGLHRIDEGIPGRWI